MSWFICTILKVVTAIASAYVIHDWLDWFVYPYWEASYKPSVCHILALRMLFSKFTFKIASIETYILSYINSTEQDRQAAKFVSLIIYSIAAILTYPVGYIIGRILLDLMK